MNFQRSVRSDARDQRVLPVDEYVCWSRMQAEAGQGLDAIVRRKECERQAGGGLFFWGVGNAPSTAIAALARLKIPVPAVFSVMKSKPKRIDVSPSRTVVWRRYFDEQGFERNLPCSSIVTSRGDSATGAKTKHYALMCRSDQPLTLQEGHRFDPAAFRNVGKVGGPVGASQVTALLRQVDDPRPDADYRVNLAAWLTGGYWVRLSDPREITAEENHQIGNFNGTCDAWLKLARHVRTPVAARARVGTEELLLL